MSGHTNDMLAIIAAERARQVAEEGWTLEHDDVHENGELATAAASYALAERARNDGYPPELAPRIWPWHRQWWKPSPKDRMKELAKSGALIVAEMERIARACPDRTNACPDRTKQPNPKVATVVGGTHDGKIVCLGLDHARRMQMPNATALQQGTWDDVKNRIPLSNEEYELDWINTGSTRFWFLRLTSLTHDQAVEAILGNYRPASGPEAAGRSIGSLAEQIQSVETMSDKMKSAVVGTLRRAQQFVGYMVGWQ